jgi:signal transduction histidine kinase
LDIKPRVFTETEIKIIQTLAKALSLEQKRYFVEKNLKYATKEAQIANQAKSQFLANMSHEIRTPLNGIIGFSQFLKQKKTDEKKRLKYLNIIHNNGQQLLMLINDILDISMIDSNQLLIKKNLFRVNPVIDQLRSDFEHILKDRKLPIEISVRKFFKNGEDKIYTDDFRLNQVLNNLLINAIKFTPKGKIEIGYDLQYGQLRFFVHDTGIGIAPHQQKEIFSRFRQVDESATRNYGGTGLGLAICKGIVELLGGEIWVKSFPETGSTFYFNIPYQIDQAENV